MAKLKIKKGDKVFVTTGNDKDLDTAKEVLVVFPQDNKVIVEGVNVVKKHSKPNAENPQGGIVEMEKPIHVSNVQLQDPSTKKPTRVGYKMEGDKKVRIAKQSGKTV